MLALDEICDGGVLLEADPAAVVARVAIRTDDIPLGEQTVAQVRIAQIFWSATTSHGRNRSGRLFRLIFSLESR